MNHLSSTYVESRFKFNTDEWPPYHPTHYTTLALIHHKGRHADTRVISQELVSKGRIFLGSYSKSQTRGEYKSFTIDISELFSYSMQTSSSANFILIEGAPGIGKTVLSKEIAYLWAVKKLLALKKLVFLLYLRDPHMKNIHLVEDLAQHMVKHGKSASSLGEYLFDTKGRDLVVILDGYDEMSEEDRKSSFIANIIKREILPQCDLVVTSRPTASVHLRDIADCRVEVLGFTEENRLDYIKHALKGSGDKIEGLQFYLQSNPTINALCYIPLNMTILLCLFEEDDKMKSANTSAQSDCTHRLGSLPTTQTEMYQNFILITINRSIKKEKQSSDDLLLKDLSNLPEPHNKIFEDLCQLAFNALRLDKIVFEFDEIKDICPNLTKTSDSWSGLGLLKAVRFINTVSFHFLHFSIQEYLAAYHVASLSNSTQIKLLKETFWEIRYFNTWIMYVGITGGEQFAWRHFISGNWFQLTTWLFGTSSISTKLLGDKIRCLHLFQCYTEIGGHEAISKLFDEEVIDLSNYTLLPKDINTLGFFLLRSSGKQWKTLDLSNCNIGDVGCNILHQQFWDKSSRQVVNIKKVNFSHNRLHAPSILILMDVFQAWHISQAIIDDDEHIDINNNYQFEMFVNKFLNCVNETASQIISVSPFLFANKAKQRSICHYLNVLTKFKALYLKSCHWGISESEMQELSVAMLKQNLHKIHIMGNALPEYIMRDIVTDASSVFVCDYTLPDEYLDNIAGVLKWTCNWLLIGCNKALGKIQHTCSVQQSTVVLLSKLLANIRKVPFNSPAFSSEVLFKLELILYNSKCVFQELVDSWHSHDFAGPTSTCLVENDVLIASKVSYYDIGKLLTSRKTLTSIFISNCTMSPFVIADLVDELELLSLLYIFDCHLVLQFVTNICARCLNRKSQLKELFIHTTNLLCSLTSDILALLSNDHNTSTVLVTKDTLACQNPTDVQIALALQLETKLTIWKLCNCFLNYQSCHHVVSVLVANAANLVALDFSGTLGQCELEMFNACFNQSQCASHLTTLKICYSKINNTALTLASTLALTNKLEELDLRGNDLQTADIIDILKGAGKISTLKVFNISHNNVTDAAANSIAVLLFSNNNLDTVDLSYNSLQAAGVVKILKGMRNCSTLRRLNVSNNNITDEAAADIAVVLVCNTKLEEIDLSCNKLHVKSAVAILKGSMNVLTAANYNIGFNSITGQEADEIITALSHGTNVNDSNSNLQTNTSIESFIAIGNLSNLVNVAVSINRGNTSQAGKCTAVIVSGDIISHLYRSDLQISKVMQSLKRVENTYISNLIKISIVNSFISDNIADDLSVVLSRKVKLKKLILSHNNLQTLSTTRIFEGMRGKSSLTLLTVSHNTISPVAAMSIANVLSCNPKLEELDLSYNNMQSIGVTEILKGIMNISNLKILNISGNNISDEAANGIGDVLSHNTKLEELNLSCNSLQAAGAIKVFNSMKEIVILKKFSISKNSITDEATDYLVPILCHNTNLEEIDLSYNRLQTAGIVKILKGLKDILSLKLLKVGNGYITDEAASDILAVLSHNNEQIIDEPGSGIVAVLSNSSKIDLSETETSIALIILKSVYNISNIRQFSMSNNSVSHDAAVEIAIIISHNINLEKLDLSFNRLQTTSAIEIFSRMKNFSNLKIFKIKNNGITDEVAKYIAAIFLYNTKLEELDLSYNRLQSAGIIKILKGIMNISNLKRLNIRGNNISDEAANDIGDVLSHNTKLEELNLSCNSLQAAGAIKVFNSMKEIVTLKKFSISKNSITDEAIPYLVPILCHNTNLEEIDLSYNRLQTVGIVKVLKGLKDILSLKLLKVGNDYITDEAASSILAVLSHNNEQIIDEPGSGIVAVLSNSSKIDLSEIETSIALIILRSVYNISNIQQFSMSNNSISYDAAMEIAIIISHNTKLEKLDLSCNRLQTARAIEIFSRMKDFSNLKIFKIKNNGITDGVAKYIAAIFVHNTKLEELDLSYNRLQSTGVIEIFHGMDMIFTLKRLNISNNSISEYSSGFLAEVLSHNAELEELDLSCNTLQAAGTVTVLKSTNSNLRKIKISNNDITNEAAKDMANILSCRVKLEELNLSHNCLQTSGVLDVLNGLKNISTLKAFNICNIGITDDVADNIVTVLSNNMALEEVDLSYNKLQVVGVTKILEGMKNFLTLKTKKLNLSYNNITDEIGSALYNTILEEVDSDMAIHSRLEVFSAVGNLSNLVNVAVCANHGSASQPGKCTAVIVSGDIILDLYHSDLQIATVLQTLDISNLIKISIVNSFISDNIANDLSLLLSHNVKLQQLVLSHNNLQTFCTTRIFEGMQGKSRLTLLTVSHNNISPVAAISIGNVLSCNPKLEELDLSYNNMQSTGVTTILKQIMNISKLKRLNISGNNISDEAANNIGDVLSHNTKLEELNLSCNSLQAAGAIKVFNSMKEIVTLKKFSISKNSITDEAIHYLVPILSRNTKLEQINLSYNRLQAAGIVKVLKELKDITALKSFSIYNNRITDEVANGISAVLSDDNGDAVLSGIKATLSNSNNEIEQIDLSEIKTTIALLVLKEMSNTSTLKQFSMRNNNISHKAAKDVAVILSYSNTLEELDLTCIDLQLSGAMEIFSEMKNVSNLRRFKINTNTISDEVAKNIAVILSHNTKLEELELSCNHFDLQTTSAIEIFNGIKRIFTLRRFSISNNSISNFAADYLAEVLSHSTSLEELELSCNTLQAEGAASILKAMESFFNLRKIKISNSGITAKDIIVAVLSRNTMLEEFDFSCNCLQNSGAVDVLNSIKSVSTIRKLSISNNGITNDAADHIATLLSDNLTLNEVDLSCNILQAAGVLRIIKQINNTVTMKRLDLSQNDITGHELLFALNSTILEEFSDNMEIQRSLGILCAIENPSSFVNMIVSNFGTACQTTNTVVAVMPFSMPDLSQSDIKIELLRLLKGMEATTNITKLQICHYYITHEAADDLAVALSHSLELEQLVLCNNSMHSAGIVKIFQGLKGLSNLIHINVSDNCISNKAADDLAVVLSRSSKLEQLVLCNNNIQSAEAVKIFQGMKNLSNLTHINISDIYVSYEAAEDLILVLSNSIKLKEFILNHSYLPKTVTIFEGMKNLSNLVCINVSHNCNMDSTADCMVGAICHNHNLEVLDISFNSSIGAPLILQGIAKDISGLKQLNVSGNGIEDDEAMHLAKFLSCNSKLELVCVSSNRLRSRGISKIFQGMNNLLNLKKVDISNNIITYEAGDTIGDVLSHNRQLKELNFSHNNLGAAGINKVFQGLTSVSYLIKLNISHTNLTDEGAEAVAAVLSLNDGLKEIDLSSNVLQPAGIITIFNSMRNIFCLTKLVVSYNNVTNEAADSIASVLSHNYNLQWLHLEKANMQLEGMLVISKTIKHIPIKLLDIKNNGITLREASIISNFLHRVTHLEFN